MDVIKPQGIYMHFTKFIARIQTKIFALSPFPMPNIFRPLLLLLTCLLLAVAGVAQSGEYALKLKNGTVVRGKLESDSASNPVLLRLQGGALLRFDKTEIDTLGLADSFSLVKVQDAPVDQVQTYRVHKQGLYFNTMGGLAFSSNNWNGISARPVIQGSSGIRLTKEIAVGAGAGLGGFAPFGGMFQAFGEVRGSIGPGKASIHYFGQGGYGTPISQGWNVEVFRGGTYFQGGGGFIFRSFRGAELYVAAGFQQQKAFIRYNTWDPFTGNQAVVTGDRLFRQILWQIGFML